MRLLAVFGLALGVGWLAHRAVVPPPSWNTLQADPAADSVQISLVFVGKQSCAWSNRPEIRTLLSRAREMLQRRADSIGARVTLVGVGLDKSAVRSARYLERLGEFEEIIAGSAGPSSLAAQYLFEGTAGSMATPQILVLVRRRHPGIAASQRGLITGGSEELVMRQVGLFELRRWVAAGARASLRPARTGEVSVNHN